MPVTIEKITYRGWTGCYRITNGEVEAVITGDVGPRVIRYGFAGGRNFLKEFDGQLGRSGEPDWQPRGGHRLWIAPEDRVRTYVPDNDPVAIAVRDGTVEATQAVERLTGLQKRIALRMAPAGSAVEVVHEVRNTGPATATIAPWAVTMMATGGIGIHGLPPRELHSNNVSPSNPLVMWAYTDLTDPRWKLLGKYMCLYQDPARSSPQKLGSFHPQTRAAYLLDGELFVKRFDAAGLPSAYPDFGCSFEAFTNGDFLELETLGPLTTLRPGDVVTHTERWHAQRSVRLAEVNDAELDRLFARSG